MSWQNVIAQIFMAALASAGFSVYYRVPRSEYLFTSIAGALCWGVYILSQFWGASEVVAVFFSAVVVSILARYLAEWRRNPVTVFLVSAIFPLVPGSYIYYTVYYLLNGDTALSMVNLRQTFTTAIALAFGIMIVTSFPSFRKKSKQPTEKISEL